MEPSDSVKFNVTVPPLTLTDPLETVGLVVSRVIVDVEVAADDGPVMLDPLVAPLAAKRGCTVPSPQPDTVSVREADDASVPGSNEQPVAVPAFEKSPESTPVTASENVRA